MEKHQADRSHITPPFYRSDRFVWLASKAPKHIPCYKVAIPSCLIPGLSLFLLRMSLSCVKPQSGQSRTAPYNCPYYASAKEALGLSGVVGLDEAEVEQRYQKSNKPLHVATRHGFSSLHRSQFTRVVLSPPLALFYTLIG